MTDIVQETPKDITSPENPTSNTNEAAPSEQPVDPEVPPALAVAKGALLNEPPVDPLPPPGGIGAASDDDDPRALFMQLGGWGKYHAYVYILSLLPHVLAGIFMVQNAFVLAPPDHR